MGYILLDTCVWVDLAATPALRPLVEELSAHTASKKHVAILPDSVKTEYARNGPEAAKRWERSFKGHVNGLNHLRDLIPEHKATLTTMVEASNKALLAGETAAALATKDVSEFLASARSFQHSAADFQGACTRCLEHKAPALRPQRSSVGDCLLWLAALRLLDDHCVWFCTSNHHDFSGTRQDTLHADLQAETASKKHKLYYFNDPTKLVENLNEIEKRAPKVALPKYSDYFPPAPSACPKCGKDLQDAGFSPSMYGGFTWKKRCVGCGFRWDTGEFMDD